MSRDSPVCRRCEDVNFRQVDTETIVLDMRGSAYFAVNHAGTLLWDLLAEPTTREALVQALTDAYQIDQVAARADVDAFLAQLETYGLLEFDGQ